MGAAAYDRGSKRISDDVTSRVRLHEFTFMDHLNSLAKAPGAARPFGDVHFVAGHGGWWAECPTTGFGYWFKSLRMAVRAFRVEVYAYSNGAWLASATPKAVRA
jgi:hypothetical protein